MAAATTIIAGTLIAGGAAMSVSASEKKRKEGKRMREEGQKGIDDFEWQDIENAIPIRTEGINMLREENARMSATAMDALRSGGTRGLGAVTDLVGYGNKMNQGVRAALEDQYMKRDYTRLGMIEQRQANELAGYGALMNTGMQMEVQSRADMANSLMGAGYSMMGVGSMMDGPKKDPPAQRPQVETTSALTMRQPTTSTYLGGSLPMNESRGANMGGWWNNAGNQQPNIWGGYYGGYKIGN